MRNLIVTLLAIVLLAAYGSLFVVYEGQRAIVFQFKKMKEGEDTKPVIYGPGLHVKVPFINTVNYFDARIKTMDGEPDRFVTSEKKDLIVDSYVKWRITDFKKYYETTLGSTSQAEVLLKDRINNGLRSEIGIRTIAEIVSGERDELMQNAMLQTEDKIAEMGIEIIDVRVKKINLPDEVSAYIFERMRSERIVVAKEHRSQGREQAEFIRAGVDAKITVMLADAQSRSRITRGEGDALAAKIYADSYGKSPEFYSFWRSLDAYKNSFTSKSDILVVKPDSDFFRFMKDVKGK